VCRAHARYQVRSTFLAAPFPRAHSPRLKFSRAALPIPSPARLAVAGRAVVVKSHRKFLIAISYQASGRSGRGNHFWTPTFSISCEFSGAFTQEAKGPSEPFALSLLRQCARGMQGVALCAAVPTIISARSKSRTFGSNAPGGSDVPSLAPLSTPLTWRRGRMRAAHGPLCC
jgi:hypothetical protein